MADKRDDYAVGYGKPPKETRFPKGQSGNPRGRPKKNKPTLGPGQIRDDLVANLHSPVRIKRGDTVSEVPAYEAILLRLVTKAANGDNRSMKLVLDLIEQGTAGREPDTLTWVDLFRSIGEDGDNEQSS